LKSEEFTPLRRCNSIGSFSQRGEHSGVRLLVVVSLLLCFSAFARVGVVRTVDGRTLQGQVRITPERIVVVNAELGSITGVEITNLAFISFPTNAPASGVETFADESLPHPWREVDVGFTRAAGSTRHESGIFTVRGAGENISGEADSFHYVFKAVRGDSEIVAQVVGIQYTHSFAKAGLMMRENLNEYSRNVMLALTAERGGALQFRSTEHFNTEAMPTRALFAPMWLKLKRQSNDFTAYISPNGRRWSLLEKISLPMNENIYVGLAVASAREEMLNWTTFSKVREAPKLVNEDFVPEVELVSGSVVRGRPVLADESEIVFTGAPKVVRVPTRRVARLTLQPLFGDMVWKTRVSRPGVWVSNGDFFDGDFRSLEGRKVTISSVLYGLRTFDIDEEVLAVVMQPRRLSHAPFEIETADGATLLANEIAFGDGELRVREVALGEVHVPAFEILELRRR
jgi:regulation of enolase protein 1 (concanavalin A-like superfamily)